jgi:hypothetical protein
MLNLNNSFGTVTDRNPTVYGEKDMGMRHCYEILKMLEGAGTLAEIKANAKEIGHRPEGISGKLASLRSWRVVEATFPKDGRVTNAVWRLTGEEMSWNVVTES